MNILRQYSPVVEQYSIDEAFVDMTGTEGVMGRTGNSSQPDTESDPGRTGFTVNVGVSETNYWRRWQVIFRSRTGCIPYGIVKSKKDVVASGQ